MYCLNSSKLDYRPNKKKKNIVWAYMGNFLYFFGIIGRKKKHTKTYHGIRYVISMDIGLVTSKQEES